MTAPPKYLLSSCSETDFSFYGTVWGTDIVCILAYIGGRRVKQKAEKNANVWQVAFIGDFF